MNSAPPSQQPPTHQALAMLDLALGQMDFGMVEAEVCLEKEGDEIGCYRLVRRLGEGGFGIVWEAEQSRPIRRTVALKVIRPGMDSLAILARFRAERRALERMSHPHIAAVLDAGTTPLGRPFFAMELVRGRPITAYCEEAGLSRIQRLQLFMEVCRGVQHAHQKAVLHRDLKPSNILVMTDDTGRPVPKVIDFGIAKALAEDATEESMIFTLRGMVMGTPEYMAPEQALCGAEDVDARADVYALGAILYELLTGTTPLAPAGADAEKEEGRKTSLTAILQRIQEAEPVHPSQRVRMRLSSGKYSPCAEADLKGDLDWIILKALEKNPERRYESANALADDVARYLADEPISARPPDRWYRLQKLVRRNRVAFAIGTVIGLNLILLAGISTYAFMQEAKARLLAESQTRKATALSDYLTRLLEQAGDFVKQGKNPEALRLALSESAKEVEQFKDEPELLMELLGRLAGAMLTMGDNRSALPLLERQLALSLQLHGAGTPPTLAIQLGMARAITTLGDAEKGLGLYREVDAGWVALGPAYAENRRVALRYHVRALAREGFPGRARDLVNDGLVQSIGDPGQQAMEHQFLADVLFNVKAYDEAEAVLRKAMELLPRDSGQNGRRFLLLRTFSRVRAKQKHPEEAATLLEEAIQIATGLQSSSHHSLAPRWTELAHLYVMCKRPSDAVRSADEAVDITRSQGNELMLPRALRGAAEVREKVGQLDAALAFRRECMALERLNNTDRGLWIYELSQILRLESALGLHEEVARNAALLWQQCQTEPAITTDPNYLRSLCKTLTAVCEKWQLATGSLAFQSDMLEWKTIMAQEVVRK